MNIFKKFIEYINTEDVSTDQVKTPKVEAPVKPSYIEIKNKYMARKAFYAKMRATQKDNGRVLPFKKLIIIKT